MSPPPPHSASPQRIFEIKAEDDAHAHRSSPPPPLTKSSSSSPPPLTSPANDAVYQSLSVSGAGTGGSPRKSERMGALTPDVEFV
jgi:hypothetical protein